MASSRLQQHLLFRVSQQLKFPQKEREDAQTSVRKFSEYQVYATSVDA